MTALFRTTLRRAGAALLLGAAAAAQCQFTGISTQSVGAHCNLGPTGCCAIPSVPPVLAPALDVRNCRLDMEVRANNGCCGVVITMRLLVLGAAPAAVPLPQFGPGCTLWVQPAVLLLQLGPVFQLPLPPSLPPLTFFAQGSALFFDPFAQPNEVVTLTDGLAITLQ